MTSHYNKLLELLNKCRVERSGTDDIYTHTSLGYPKGCFNIGEKDRDKFNQLYSKVITENKNPLYLTEKHRKQGSILIDLDFKYHDLLDNRKITKLHYYTLIEQYIYNIIKYIKLDDAEEQLKCYILTKPHPTTVSKDEDSETTLYKDGVHIIFPNICTEPLVQHLIRENVIKYLQENNTWNDLNLSNEIDDVIDKAVIEKNNWLMYGSAKPDHETNNYRLDEILTWQNGLLNIEFDESDILRLPEVLSIRKYGPDNIFSYSDGFDENIISDELKKYYKTHHKSGIIIGKPSEISLASKLTGILSIKRTEKYEEWINVGFCLHNIGDALLEDWILFSKKSKKYKEGECEKMWIKFKNIGYSIGSLHKWASNDDHEKYMDIIIDENYEILSKSISGQPYDIAKAFFELYKHNFRIGSIDFKEWYYFDIHRWKPMQDAYIIKDMLNESMVNAYVRLGIIYGKKALKLEGSEKNTMLSRQEILMKISLKLRGPFKEQIIKELSILFKKYDPDFTNKLDENKNLICFINGIYDLENDLFREGRPDDYITLCTNINYVATKNLNTRKLQIVNKFLIDIQPEEDMRNYILDLFASCLAGNNKDQKFNIWTGSGSNGKSLVVTLMMESLGEYACGLPPEVLTRASMDPDKASPTMAKTKGKRFVVFEETENTDQIYVGKMKAYSGGVKIQARKLHKDVIEFYPQFKMFLLCNKLPNIPSNDGGTWRRIRLVPFEMKFVDNPSDEHERQIDRGLEDVLTECREEFIHILLQRYQIYKANGLNVPSKVMASTQNYQSNSDLYLDYINECLEFTGDMRNKIDLNDVVLDIQFWLKSRGDKKTLQKNDIKNEIEDKIGKCKLGNVWKGFLMKPHDNKKVDNLLDNPSEEEEEENEIREITTYEKFRSHKMKKV